MIPQSMDPGAYPSLGALLWDAFIQFKTETALIETSRRRTSRELSYTETGELAKRAGAHLKKKGIGADARVAILMSNQPSWLIGATGALFAGATLVPLDYKLTAPEQAALLKHAKPQVLFVEYGIWRSLAKEVNTKRLKVYVTDVPEGQKITGAKRFEALFDAEPMTEVVARGREDLACIVYSSGTGGQAKGCMLVHDCYLAQLEALMVRFPMAVGDRFFSVLPTNHAIDFMSGFVGPFASGATVIHQRTLRPEFILATMKQHKPTHMAIVPLLLTAFERAIDDKLNERPPIIRSAVGALGALNRLITERRPNHGLSSRLLKPIHDGFGGSLKVLFCGGAFVDRARAERFYELGLPVAIGYGLTECCTVATVNDLRPFRADSVGNAVPGVELKIHEPDADGVGEVWIRGRTVMRGYLDAPELTAETLEDGWLKTGDRGYLDASHHLHLVGRSRNMIVTAGGKNIYPEDIETNFSELPCEEMAVFAADYIWPRQGLVGERLVAVVRPKEGDDGELADGLSKLMPRLREQNRRLSDFKRLDGVLSWTEAFPRTASMKIKRQALAEQIRNAVDADAIARLSA